MELFDSEAAINISGLNQPSGIGERCQDWVRQQTDKAQVCRETHDPKFTHSYAALYPMAAISERTEPIRADYAKGNRLAASASMGIWALSQPIGALRVPSITAAWLSLKLHNPAVAMGIITSWNLYSSEVFRNLLKQHPNTVDSLGSKSLVQGAINLCGDSLLGQQPNIDQATEKDPLPARCAKEIRDYLKLGVITLGVGLQPTIVAGELTKKSKKEIRKLYIKGSMASGSVMALSAAAVTTSVAAMNESHPHTAEAIVDTSQNVYCLIGAAALMVTASQGPKIKNKVAEFTKRNKLTQHYRRVSEEKRIAEGYAKLRERYTLQSHEPVAPALSTLQLPFHL